MSKANTLKSEKKTKSSIQLYKKVADIGENKGIHLKQLIKLLFSVKS